MLDCYTLNFHGWNFTIQTPNGSYDYITKDKTWKRFIYETKVQWDGGFPDLPPKGLLIKLPSRIFAIRHGYVDEKREVNPQHFDPLSVFSFEQKPYLNVLANVKYTFRSRKYRTEYIPNTPIYFLIDLEKWPIDMYIHFLHYNVKSEFLQEKTQVFYQRTKNKKKQVKNPKWLKKYTSYFYQFYDRKYEVQIQKDGGGFSLKNMLSPSRVKSISTSQVVRVK